MTLHVLVVGGGRVGSYLASLLLGEGHRVHVIDIQQRDSVVSTMPAAVWHIGNGTDPLILEKAGIRQVNVVAAVTDADETNLVISNLARFEFNVRRVVARVNHPKNAWLFTPAMGVDVALNQADVMAHLIAEEMSLGDMVTLLKLRKGQYAVVEERVHPSARAARHPIHTLDFPEECVLSAIIRQGQLIIPRGHTILQPGDEVIAVVHTSQKARLAALLSAAETADMRKG